MARPTKFNQERARKIIKYVRNGNFKNTAARAAGVNIVTLDRWIAAGRAGKNKELREFCIALDDAEAMAEVDAVESWLKAHVKSPGEIKEYLRRRFPDNWNIPDKRESSVTFEDKNIKVIDVRMENLLAKYDRRKKANKR